MILKEGKKKNSKDEKYHNIRILRTRGMQMDAII